MVALLIRVVSWTSSDFADPHVNETTQWELRKVLTSSHELRLKATRVCVDLV